MAHNEILIEVRIPLRHNTSSAYAKVERRVGDWAVTAAGAAVTLDGDQIAAARVGLTAVNAVAEGLAAVRDALIGAPPTEETFAEAGRLAAAGLRTRHRSARHRRLQAAPGLRADHPDLAHRRRASPRHPGTEGELMHVTMSVNGEQVDAEIEPRMLLVHFLRDQLRLTGTHWGCDTSNCGTCVVAVDGEPVKSCTMLAAMASGHDIRTVEGLADGATLDPVQEGFMQCHGLQCGFCTPGMMITARALLDRNPDPSEKTRSARPSPGRSAAAPATPRSSARSSGRPSMPTEEVQA